MVGVPTNGTGPTSPGPVVAFSWLDWSRDGDEYVGGEYRIRLVEPYQWEVLYRGEHLRFDERLSAAFAWAGHHHIEALRRRDMVAWVLVVAGCLTANWVIWATLGFSWGIPLLIPLVYIGLSALARLLATIASQNRDDPYRRRAPWEPRAWWLRYEGQPKI